MPSGMVSDRLRYTEDVSRTPPATEFLRRAFAEPGIIKGIICHGLWLVAPAPELVRGRPLVVHNNLIGDARNMGAIYTDQDLVVDGDLVTARTGGHCHLLARAIIDLIASKEGAPMPRPEFSHYALNCTDPVATERFYARHFGFERARVVPLGGNDQIVFLRAGNLHLELFQSARARPRRPPRPTGHSTRAGATWPSRSRMSTRSSPRWAPTPTSRSGHSASTTSSPAGGPSGSPIRTATSSRSTRGTSIRTRPHRWWLAGRPQRTRQRGDSAGRW